MPQNPLEGLKKALGISRDPDADLLERISGSWREEDPPPSPPKMRARTWGESISDALRGLYEGASKSLPGMATDALGVSDFKGGEESFSKPSDPNQTLLGMVPFGPEKGLEKAGLPGMYSRAGRAVSELPKEILPAPALKQIGNKSSGEELKIRKLGDFLGAKDPNIKIPREAIEEHLASNPLPELRQKTFVLRLRNLGGLQIAGDPEGGDFLKASEILNRVCRNFQGGLRGETV